MPRELREIIQRTCSICGRKISVRIYKKPVGRRGNYRGGHYFGKIPFHRKKDLEKASKNTKKVTMGGFTYEVFKKDPKPYKHEEYWECPSCYWQYKK